MGKWYPIGGRITAAVVFLGLWLYAIASWGFPLGLGFGRSPAGIAAIIAGFLWPLIAIAIALLILFIAGSR